jgi:hypothetical protein
VSMAHRGVGMAYRFPRVCRFPMTCRLPMT